MRTRKSPLPPEAPRKCEPREEPLSWRGIERILRGLVVPQYLPLKGDARATREQSNQEPRKEGR